MLQYECKTPKQTEGDGPSHRKEAFLFRFVSRQTTAVPQVAKQNRATFDPPITYLSLDRSLSVKG